MLKRIIPLGIIICAITSFLFFRNSNIYCNTSTKDNINFINVNREKDFIEIEIDFSKLPYQIVYNEKNEANIVMPNLGKNTNAGEPELPKTIFRVGILPNVKRESIKLKIIQQEITDLGAGYNITPVETPRPALEGWNDQNYLNEEFKSERDLSIYNRDNLFPYSPIIISPLSNIKDWIFVSIELWPFQYNPKNSTLKRVDYIKCRIDFELDKTNMKQYNTDDFHQDKFHEPWKGSYKNSSTRDGNGYVIITTNDIVSNSKNMDDFIGCKENCGYSVQVVTEDDYGSIVGQPPNGTSEKIRQWLIDNYLSLNLQYVLLIGDPDPDDPYNPDDHIGDIPMKMLYPRVGNAYTGYSTPSDYFYADLTGNWNLDGDELFGEHRSSSEPVTPDPQIDENTFSIRWTGKINVTDPDGIRISPIFDDGIRIWIDDLSGDPVINEWSDHLAGGGMGYDILTPGLHDIKIEYYQNMSNSFFRLQRRSLGGGGIYYIPGNELYYWDGTSYQQGGLNGEYYNDMDLTDYVFSRIDPNNPSAQFNFNWFSGDRGDGGVDFSPEVSVGRIPVYDNDYFQLDEIFDKLIAYQYSSDTSWRNNVLLPMKPFDVATPSYQLGEQIRTELCEPNDFNYYRIYDEDYACTPPPEATPCTEDNVLTAWQNPFGLVTWATHGSSSGAISVLYSSSCPQLDDDKPAFVFQGSCNNGWPEVSNNLGYSLLKNGAVATVSSSRVSWYTSGNLYASPGNLKINGFCFYYSKYVIENNSTGESLNLVKDVLASSLHDFEWMNVFDFNLYGDPALKLTSSPSYSNIKVFLEGPYDAIANLMQSSVTLTTISPYDNEDISSLPTVTGHSLVDWIQVKLRTTVTGSTVSSCNAFLLENGSVVDVNGNSSLPFYNTSGNEYYIVIHHRNHLNIMSSVKHAFGSSQGEATNIDLTTSGSIYGEGCQELETSVYGMYSGDINNDGEVTTSDYTSWYNAYITGSSGYQITDLNMDGEVTTSDYTKWYNNFIVGASSSIPDQTRESSGGSKKIILKKIEENTKKNVWRKHGKQIKN